MKIDGRAIAADINARTKSQVSTLSKVPVLVIVRVGDDSATDSFLRIKQKVADVVGIQVILKELGADADHEAVHTLVHKVVEDSGVDAVVVQLPVPLHIDTDAVLDIVPSEKDPDALGSNSKLCSPVAGAVQEVLERNTVVYKNKKILVVGQGRLVGAPVTKWLKEEGVDPMSADEHTEDLSALTKKADIIISGVGAPHFITADMIKDQVVLIDAGTSSDGGVLKGDIHPDCYQKASLYTPVPGGVGPITVAKLFENVVILREQRRT